MTCYLFFFFSIIAIIQAFFQPYIPYTQIPPLTYSVSTHHTSHSPQSPHSPQPPQSSCLSTYGYDLDIEDTTIITNALHYYKKVDKKGNFNQYTPERINKLRNKIIDQQMKNAKKEEKIKTKTKDIFPPMFLLFL